MAEDVTVNIVAHDNMSTVIGGIQGALLTFNQVMSASKQVFQAVKDVIDDTVGAFVDYAGEVQKLQILTGGTAQDTSRLISIFKDYGGTVNDLTMATKTLAKEGLSLTIDQLAKMSDQYKNLATAADRTEFLIKNFGRSGADLAIIMDQGSKAILAQAAALNANMVLDDAAIKKAQDLKLANAEMGDGFEGLKIQIGAMGAPTLTYAANIIALRMEAHNLHVEITNGAFGAYKDYDHLLADVNTAMVNQTIAANSLANGIANLDKGDRDNAKTLNTLLIPASRDYKSILDSTTPSLKQIGAAAYENSLMVNGMITPEALRKAATYELQLGLLSRAEYDAKIKASDMQAAIDAMADKHITITTDMITNMITQYSTVAVNPPHMRASGGSFSGWAMVGDSPGGGVTPYTEFVYAPHGATVYNQSQMSGKSAPPMAGGGVIGGNMELSDKSLSKLADLFTMALAKRK